MSTSASKTRRRSRVTSPVDRVGRRTAAIVFGTAFLAYLLDRVTKFWAGHTLPGRPIDLIPGVLTLRYTTNSGGAFSLGESAPWLFVGATVVVIVAIVVTAFRHMGRLHAVALGLVLGGAFGNLTDRVIRGPGLRGRVVDFVDLHVWPVFNVADSAIVVGALLIGVASLRSGRQGRDEAREDVAGDA
jgi:signal peptidase II